VKQNNPSAHWDKYYKSKDVPALPSQFAVFMLGEFQPGAVVDIGCGSGRDAFYFANQHIPTVGIDGSTSAVELCNSKSDHLDHLTFIQSDINDADLPKQAEEALTEWGVSTPIMVYARFFVHAINEEGERHLFSHARTLLEKRGGVFAAEFRTTRDKSMEKVTPDHYRRFVNTADFASTASSFGFECRYSVEGFGFAKYKEDDAHVARFVLSLRN
jgi:cyclopropane fatty-acyl-phospholipid synthase-like methyltransferase